MLNADVETGLDDFVAEADAEVVIEVDNFVIEDATDVDFDVIDEEEVILDADIDDEVDAGVDVAFNVDDGDEDVKLDGFELVGPTPAGSEYTSTANGPPHVSVEFPAQDKEQLDSAVLRVVFRVLPQKH